MWVETIIVKEEWKIEKNVSQNFFIFFYFKLQKQKEI